MQLAVSLMAVINEMLRLIYIYIYLFIYGVLPQTKLKTTKNTWFCVNKYMESAKM
jgi:hypothetical protein